MAQVNVVQKATRRERALSTRRRMIEAARDLFSEHGYSIPMELIAERAGVAHQTLYFTFHRKPDLLREVVLTASVGSGDSVEVRERSWFVDALQEADARRALALFVQNGVDITERIAPLNNAIQGACAADEQLREYFAEMTRRRRQGMHDLATHLQDLKVLRKDLDVNRATDILFVLSSPQTHQAFRKGCGWGMEEFKSWLYRALIQALHADMATSRREGPPAD